MAAVAFGLDSVLKGYMRGREHREQEQAYKAKRLSDGLRYAYDAAAQQYTSLIQSGADPKSEEVQKADLAQRAAYQSLMQMQQNYVEGQLGKDGKSKSKKSKGGGQSGGQGAGAGQQQEDPVAMIASQDPNEKLRGLVALQNKVFSTIGTPANAAARQYLTPEYQAQRKLMQGQQEIAGNRQALELELSQLDKSPNLDEKQSKRRDEILTRLQEFKTGRDQYSTVDIPGKSLAGKMDIFGNAIDANGTYREVRRYTGELGYIPSTAKPSASPKPASADAFFTQVAQEAGIPVNELSAESRLGLNHSWSTSKSVGHVTNGHYMYTDDNGQVVDVPITRTSQPSETATVPHVTKGGQSTGAGASGTTSSAAHHTATPTASAPHAAGAGTGNAHIISPPGHEKASAESKNVLEESKKLAPLANLLTTQTQYMDAITKDPSKATPRQDLALVVAAVRAMNPGSVRLPQKELELEMKAGSFGDRFSRAYDIATTGLLPNDQRNDLFAIVKNETTTAGENIVQDWKASFPNRPLPAHLQQFDKTASGSTGGAGGGTVERTIRDSKGNEIKVKVVDGKWVNSATGQPIQ